MTNWRVKSVVTPTYVLIGSLVERIRNTDHRLPLLLAVDYRHESEIALIVVDAFKDKLEEEFRLGFVILTAGSIRDRDNVFVVINFNFNSNPQPLSAATHYITPKTAAIRVINIKNAIVLNVSAPDSPQLSTALYLIQMAILADPLPL